MVLLGVGTPPFSCNSHLAPADRILTTMQGPALLLALLLAAGAGRAQVVVDSGKAAGTYDPCLDPPTGVSVVRAEIRARAVSFAARF